MELDQLLKELKEKFYNKNTFLKSAHACEESVLQTIKSLFLKKNLIIVSKVEYEELITTCQNAVASEIINEILLEEAKKELSDFKHKQYLRDLPEPEKIY